MPKSNTNLNGVGGCKVRATNEMPQGTFRNSGCDALPAEFDTLLDLVEEVCSLNLQVIVGAGEDVFYTRCSPHRAGLNGEAPVAEFVAVYAGLIREFLHRHVICIHTPRCVIARVWGCRGILQHVLNDEWWRLAFVPLRPVR